VQDEVNQEESEQDEVYSKKKTADFTGKGIFNLSSLLYFHA